MWISRTLGMVAIIPLIATITEPINCKLTSASLVSDSAVRPVHALSSSSVVKSSPNMNTAKPTATEPTATALSKRSVPSAEACASHNIEITNPQGRLVEVHTYRWLSGSCSMHSPNLFLVTCDHETRRVRSGAISHQNRVWAGRCKRGRVCFRLRNQTNFRGERVDDVSCRIPANGKTKDPYERTEKTIPIRPRASKPTTACSSTIEIPLSTRARSSSGKGTGSGQRRYSLSQDLKLTDGLDLRSPDMYILDVSAPILWKRSEVKDANSDSIDLTIIGDAVRKIQFCAVLAAGFGYSTLLHYVVQDVTGGRSENESMPVKSTSDSMSPEHEL